MALPSISSAPPRYAARSTIRQGPLCVGLILLTVIPLVIINLKKTRLDDEELLYKIRDTHGGRPRLGKTKYSATNSWKTNRTLGKKLLGETQFAKCEVHSVLSTDGKSIIRDWLFMEERNAINVAVYTDDKQFLTFRQEKYAIPGETLALVGGFVDDNETPFESARREVYEELGMGSMQSKKNMVKGAKPFTSKSNPQTSSISPSVLDKYNLPIGTVPDDESSDWIFLGRYRTMANRGGGFLYSYLLKHAVPLVEDGGTDSYRRTGDAESQQLVRLSREEATKAVLNGSFQEIKWSATMSMALMHLSPSSTTTAGE